MDEVEDWSDYESGPFCIHWREAYDCEEPCPKCDRPCNQHYGEDCSE